MSKSIMKNIQMYSIDPDWVFDEDHLLKVMASRESREIGRMDLSHIGWGRFENGEFIIRTGDKLLLKLTERKKVVPPAAVKMELNKKVKDFERKEGRSPARKEKNELKDEVMMEILPKALEVEKNMFMIIDIADKRMYVGAGTLKAGDDIAGAVVEDLGISVVPYTGSEDMVVSMTHWLMNDGVADDESFAIGGSCSMEGADEKKSKVKLSNVNLSSDECREHVAVGYKVVDIELYIPDTVSFTITKDTTIKKLAFDDMFIDSDDELDDEVSFIMAQIELIVDAVKSIDEALFPKPA